MKKRFHISDVISITDGRLVGTRHMDGIYEILGHMTGEELWTHQLPRAAKQCQPFLNAQFPQLLELVEPDTELNEQTIPAWLDKQIAKFGEWFDVEQLPPGENGPHDMLQEAIEIFGKDRVIPVVVEDPTP